MRTRAAKMIPKGAFLRVADNSGAKLVQVRACWVWLRALAILGR